MEDRTNSDERDRHALRFGDGSNTGGGAVGTSAQSDKDP